MDLTPRRRRALSTILAVALAIESVGAVAAAARVNVAQRDAGRTAEPTAAAVTSTAVTPPAPVADVPADSTRGVEVAIPKPAPAAAITYPKPARPDAPPTPVRSAQVTPSTASSGTTAATSAVRYSGRNHVWIPSLGISRSVSYFPCDRERPPDNFVYRWGCSGTNNVYLLGHAYSVFKPLHDAYTSHRLKVGLKAYYADANGKVHAYAVKWWKTTPPTTSASWAWAAQSTPSMTLQTCVGANSQLRLMVRLVEVRG
jgi:hypothetical protein